MHVAIAYCALPDSPGADESDVLLQVEAVEQALAARGIETARVPADLNLREFRNALAALKPDLVFNLVEALDGRDDLHPLAPFVYESLGLPYTGCPGSSLVWTANKIRTKQRLREVGLPTADWYDAETDSLEMLGRVEEVFPSQWIIKSLVEHASAGLDDDSVVTAHSPDDLRAAAAARGAQRRVFCERFISGRELNLGLLSDGRDLTLLTPGEYLFDGFPAGKPKIVSYHTKWLAYHLVPRKFDHAESDRVLLAELADLARRCWKLFELRGYARVDFRIDEAGRPYILEVNCNPCLTPDASYTCALDYAGIPHGDAIAKIVDASLPRAAVNAAP